ncbi:hypothetical protein [Salimicrobium halophilum]|uniref:Uncharacterized protein n=1 Tax=Salimicrobium halophilum TaxID=86666 RepID=A0A1G8WAS3_9BACI|nr:hypothetical protein [Salimicrobium halophilum]SDJ75313.1 hypothetical protein SAMN04490247_3101 [Salimicrobium halophilum]
MKHKMKLHRLKELHPVTWTLIAFIAVMFPTWMYTSYGMIHEEHLTEATVSEKYHEEEDYYIVVDDQKIKVKDTSKWMLVEADETYEITYEWYGTKTPHVVSINQAHDDDSVGGSH